jgi:two-component system response regulator NreC
MRVRWVYLAILELVTFRSVSPEKVMSITVLLADDSDVMRGVVRRLLKEEPRITLVGEAVSFAQTMQMRADFRPAVLLMDLHLPEKRDFTPAFVKSQLRSTRLLAISVTNDDEASELAASYGALVLLDKTRLYSKLIPTVMKFAQSASGTSPLDTQSIPSSTSNRKAA